MHRFNILAKTQKHTTHFYVKLLKHILPAKINDKKWFFFVEHNYKMVFIQQPPLLFLCVEEVEVLLKFSFVFFFFQRCRFTILRNEVAERPTPTHYSTLALTFVSEAL